jgi:SAM-dependent methyltransferase
VNISNSQCRSCEYGPLHSVLSLGEMPLANALLRADQLELPERVFPLDLAFCPRCSLVQLLETVPPAMMFSDYPYFSSFSDTAVRQAQTITARLIASRHLDASALVVELASNDGYLLQFYKKAGIEVLGIEPASNVAAVAVQERGIPTRCEFFSVELAKRLADEEGPAQVIHANNVLAHVPDLNGVVEGIRILLDDRGVAVIEVPYVKEMVERCEFDTIYHEHLCYFSATALHYLLERHGLLFQNVERLTIHGGSLRIFAVPKGSASPTDAVAALLAEERAQGVDRIDFYLNFGRRAEKLKFDLREALGALTTSGRKLAAYGAAAKGSTLLNYCGIGRETLDYVVDRSTYKQGLFMPGVRLPIYPPEKLTAAMPSHVLLLAWNFADEIMGQQSEYRRRGGHFVIPVPEPRIV